jgi:CMP/dCMP kinase
MDTSKQVLPGIEQMQAVTLSREYGSGGGEIAARLARALGWRLLDHEAVIQVAQELRISVTDAEAQDEYGESLGMRLLNDLSFLQPPLGNVMYEVPVFYDSVYHETMRNIVETALTSGHVVIVGRGSQMLIKERRDILHVRIVAPLEQRITYVMQREELSFQNAQARIRDKESGRIRYLQRQYHQDPADPVLYDLVINTAILSLDSTVQLIRAALEQKASRLSVPASDLGPGAGLPLYPARAEDFPLSSGHTSTGTRS